MSDETFVALRRSPTLHPGSALTSGSPFFDARDLVQVTEQLMRRVRVDGDAVSHATALCALSRPTLYAAQAAWEHAGIIGLLPEPTGPRLTEELIAQLEPLATTLSSAELAAWVREQHHLTVHPRSIERTLARATKKGGDP